MAVRGCCWRRGEKVWGVHTQFIGRWLDVENDYFDVFSCEEKNHFFPDAVATACQNHDLPTPVPFRAFPVVKGTFIQDAVEPSSKADIYEDLEAS